MPSETTKSLLKRMKDKSAIGEDDVDLQVLEVHSRKMLKLTVAEVRALCDDYPDHPLTKSKRKSVRGLPDTMQVVVEQDDVEAMSTGKNIELYKEINRESGETIVKKRLVDLPSTRQTSVTPSAAVASPPSK